jgi:hypothetical protein
VSKLRRHFTYANVLATLTAFAVLCGGAAIAANQLGKNSVGRKQLKANSVTTAKIKKNAVSAAKIRAGAIDGTKVKDGSLSAPDFLLSDMPYTRVAGELRLPVSITAPLPPATFAIPGGSYVQEAGRTDTYVGAVDLSLDPSCTDPNAVAFLLMDAPDNGGKLDFSVLFHVAAVGFFSREGQAPSTGRINLGPFLIGGTSFASAAPRTHQFSLVLGGGCKSGGPVTATKVSVDVIGTRGAG